MARGRHRRLPGQAVPRRGGGPSAGRTPGRPHSGPGRCRRAGGAAGPAGRSQGSGARAHARAGRSVPPELGRGSARRPGPRRGKGSAGTGGRGPPHGLGGLQPAPDRPERTLPRHRGCRPGRRWPRRRDGGRAGRAVGPLAGGAGRCCELSGDRVPGPSSPPKNRPRPPAGALRNCLFGLPPPLWGRAGVGGARVSALHEVFDDVKYFSALAARKPPYPAAAPPPSPTSGEGFAKVPPAGEGGRGRRTDRCVSRQRKPLCYRVSGAWTRAALTPAR
ncbi:hypothetical protein MTBUT4_80063 [Magnetospirillum sp. UT-4]|nr:hypothetical protein MTBUT4_80063 [Magnetospirillum sp. UT-4]